MRCWARPAAARPRCLNIISGLLQPSEGKILFDGKDVTNLSTQERNIAQVFQFPVIYDTMTVTTIWPFRCAIAAFRKMKSIAASRKSLK